MTTRTETDTKPDHDNNPVNAVFRHAGLFKPGNQAHALRKVKSGGRPLLPLSSINEVIDGHPERIRDLFDNIYALAMGAESEKVRLAASIDYLDRVGFRAPKETNVNFSGQVMVGTPEDYRRTALLIQADQQRESQALLTDGAEAAGEAPIIEGEIVEETENTSVMSMGNGAEDVG